MQVNTKVDEKSFLWQQSSISRTNFSTYIFRQSSFIFVFARIVFILYIISNIASLSPPFKNRHKKSTYILQVLSTQYYLIFV